MVLLFPHYYIIITIPLRGGAKVANITGFVQTIFICGFENWVSDHYILENEFALIVICIECSLLM